MDEKNRQKGFTIVELLVVIVVIAILAAITIVAYNGITKRTMVARDETNLRTIANKLEVFYLESNRFPDANLDGKSPSQTLELNSTNSDGSSAFYDGDCKLPPMTKDKYCINSSVNEYDDVNGHHTLSVFSITYWNKEKDEWIQQIRSRDNEDGINEYEVSRGTGDYPRPEMN